MTLQKKDKKFYQKKKSKSRLQEAKNFSKVKTVDMSKLFENI